MLTTYPVSKLLAFTASDAHPPGYYLALKAWNKAARVLGFEPGVFWARSLNMVIWLLLTLVVWFGGRRLAGPKYGPLIAWATAANACAALVARDMRSYGITTVALAACYFTLVFLAETIESGRTDSRIRILALWAVYGLVASIALWTHLLSAFALAVLTVLWLVFFVRRRHLDRTFIVGMAVAHAFVVVSFLPWLVKIQGQLAYLEQSKPEWMTPPTLANLLRVFTFWFPFGRISVPHGASLLIPLGIIAVAVPVLVALWPLMTKRSSRAYGSFLSRAGFLGVSSAGLFVVLLWLLHRQGISYTFHGPRYPVLTIHLWAGGLALMVIGTAQRLRWNWRRSVFPIVPWLLCSAIGQVVIARGERISGIDLARKRYPSLFPTNGEDLYIMPSELIPFYRATFTDFSVKGVEQLFCVDNELRGATVLNLNFWPNTDRSRDHIVRYLLDNSQMAERVLHRPIPEGREDYSIYRLDVLKESTLRHICQRGLASKLEIELPQANSKALAEDQVNGFHWSFLEVGQDFQTSRWATSLLTPVVFDRNLVAGEYVLHFIGYRSSFPHNPLKMRIVLKDASEMLDQSTEVSSGQFHLRFFVEVTAKVRSPVLLIEHATWSPAEVGASRDTRRLSFSFIGAWFETALPRTSQ